MLGNQTQVYFSASSSPGNFGASIYNELFRRQGLNAIYLPRRVTDAFQLTQAIRTFGISGCSVSMPLKSQVLPHLDDLEPMAREVQSVNTIVNNEGQLVGFNTDIYGAEEALKKLAISTFSRIIIHGYGSVTRSLIAAIGRVGSPEVVVTGRNCEKAQKFATEHNISADSLENLTCSSTKADLVINATPASKANRKENEALYELINLAKACFDLVVTPEDTPWVREVERQGKPIIRGVEMSQYQLQKQLERYTGLKVSIDEIELILREKFLSPKI